MVAVAVLLDLAGVAGYRLGLVLVAIPMVLGSTAWCWLLVRRSPSRVAWTIAAAIIGLTATAALGERAPSSRGALEQQLDELDLPFFEVERQVETGHSWCRPSCPSVERVYRVPDVGVQSTMVTIGLALAKEGLVAPEDLRRVGSDRFLRVGSARVQVEVRVVEADDGTIDAVRIRYRSLRSG